jgi:endogenous inhibitor of DNA gyrase (YacG/DUF329 family)
MADDTETRRRPARCPICGRPADPALHPFCTKRCADVDLARWLGGVYRVEVDDPDAEADDGEEPPRLQ